MFAGLLNPIKPIYHTVPSPRSASPGHAQIAAGSGRCDEGGSAKEGCCAWCKIWNLTMEEWD
jgi:hypothetical protein